jgi:hypothetical protein
MTRPLTKPHAVSASRWNRVGKITLKNHQPIRMADQDLLQKLTGHDATYWFIEVQHLIETSHVGRKVKGHHRNTLDWPAKLAKQVEESFPKIGPAFDGNMRMAIAMGYIMTYWYARVHHAKAMDPNRPLNLRRDAYRAWLNSAGWFSMIWIDETRDKDLMHQKWNHPFWPGAKGGKFV